MTSNSFNNLIDVIRAKSILISENTDEREDLGVLFMKSLKKTVIEIQNGANSDEFSELTVINLIILGHEEGYTAEEMRWFVEKLKAPENDEDFENDEDDYL